MGKSRISDSVSEESESEDSLGSEEEAEDPIIDGQKQKQNPPVCEYEKQRLSRIAENRARMEALGLSKLASSLMGSPQSQDTGRRKGKRKLFEDDEDYRPNDDDDDDQDGDGDDDEDDDFSVNKASRSRKGKVKNKAPKAKKKVHVQKQLSSSNQGNEDDELMKAIALSLQDSAEFSGAVHKDVQDATFGERKGNTRTKKKKSFTSRVQMTEDEMVMHFFQFDETGKGSITRRDLRRVAIAHDFTWSDEELADMIHYFDSDGDGKLNLDDFQKIVSRCNMLRSSESS